jgi:hypothetical protein
MFPAQVAGEFDGGRTEAAYQRDVLVLAFLIGQLKARFPIASCLAAPQCVNFLLEWNTRCVLGGGSP